MNLFFLKNQCFKGNYSNHDFISFLKFLIDLVTFKFYVPLLKSVGKTIVYYLKFITISLF